MDLTEMEDTQTLSVPSKPDHAARMDALRARQTADEDRRKEARIQAALEDAAMALTRLAVLAPQHYFCLIAKLAIEAHAKLPDSEKPAAEAAIMKEVTP